jgi:hypothetical protein
MGRPGSKDPHRHQLTQTFAYEFFLFQVEIEVKKRTLENSTEIKVEGRTRSLKIVGGQRHILEETNVHSNTYSGL